MTSIPIPILPKPSKDYPETIDNRAVLQELETIQKKLLSKEIEEYVAPIDSREELQQLEVEKETLAARIAAIGTTALLTGLTTFSIAWLGILLTWKPATRLEKVARVIKLINTILGEFEALGVETLPLIRGVESEAATARKVARKSLIH